MAIENITVVLSCDECGEGVFIDLPSLVSFGEDRLKRELEKETWVVSGDRHLCPNCAAEEEDSDLEEDWADDEDEDEE